MNPSSARVLAGWGMADIRPPSRARGLIRSLFLDFVGLAAFGGADGESSPPLRAAARLYGAVGGDCTVVGQADASSPPLAALLNGAFAHTLDFDDTNAVATLHPGAPVIAAALAQAERTGCSGRAFVDALIVGYETCCRIGAACTAATYDRGFHLTSVAGIFGAVAAAARLGGASPAVVDAAFGFAGSRAAGSMQYLANGAWNKRYHPGFAAHDALVVLALAEAGGRGAEDALEGQHGLLAAYSPAARPDRLLAGLGEEWLMLETAIKPYPSCRLAHGAIDAARALRARLGEAGRIASGTITLSPTAAKIVGRREPNTLAPANIVDGQFSVYFQTAVTLLHGAPTWTSYERIGEEAVNDLAARLSVNTDEGFAPTECRLAVATADGPLAEHVAAALGEPSRPLGWTDAVSKFHGLADPVFGAAHARAIVAAIDGIEAVADMRDLARSLRTEVRDVGRS